MAGSSAKRALAIPLRRCRRGRVQLREKKLRRLKKMIPGCSQDIEVDELLQRTVEYIYFLEMQVIVLRRASNLDGASGFSFL
ncbi:hypothetical protein Cni_G22657 [Canna indica]|uniref:BHLH domain-containing protein n=1 Tax=Canna indica TaxID=4628 RepID=A0AAQ3KYB9_9LILI|nr:hypothetical protein Cni_G22657 [Canna indica]